MNKLKSISNGKSEYVEVFANANLGAFGLLLPKNTFAGVSLDGKTEQAIAAVLKNVSFGSLNIVSSAAGVMFGSVEDGFGIKAHLKEIESRTKIEAFDKDGKPLRASDGAFAILGLNPAETIVKAKDSRDPSTSVSAQPGVNISQLVKALLASLKEEDENASNPNESGDKSALDPIELVKSLAGTIGGTMGLVYKPDNRLEEKLFASQKPWIANDSEFCWYFSGNPPRSEGIHHGTAFLQLSRMVAKLKVTTTIKTDFGTKADFVHKFVTELDVNHPSIPTTPILSDLSSPQSIPIVVPASDVKKLLNVDDSGLKKLIEMKDGLVAFGSKKQVISKGSLIKLLGLSAI